MMGRFVESVTGIGTLAEPVRRDLYLYVCAQPTAVGRDEAADALGVPRHKAKFHLERLAAEGLLEVEFARLGGKSGPGAGRPSKLYRRSSREIAVSLPDREYEFAGRLMADAIAESARTGTPVMDALSRAASARGQAIGAAAVEASEPPATGPDALDIACRALAEHGYEPRPEEHRVILANCPFHALAATHTELVCGMNAALIGAVASAVDPAEGRVGAHLDPGEGRCCVVLTDQSRG